MQKSWCSPFLLAALLFGQEPQPPVPAGQPDPAKPPPKAPAAQVLPIGGELPTDLTLRDLDGAEHKLGALRGKVVVLHFWSSTCPTEELAEPKLIQLAADFAGKDVAVFGVASNHGEIGEPPDAAAFEQKEADKRPYAALRKKVAQISGNHPILADHGGALAKLLGAQTTPHCFVFDQKGMLRYRGALDDAPKGETDSATKQYVRVAVEAVRGGEAVPIAETKAYG